MFNFHETLNESAIKNVPSSNLCGRKFEKSAFFSSAQDSHFGLRMKWTADFHRLLNRDYFKNPKQKQNQNKFKFLKLFLSGKALEFSQCLLVCVYFETIFKLPVVY